MEPDRPLYTQALQIAALESLTYALDCSQQPADEAHSTQQPSTGYAYCPGGHCLHSRSPCLGSPASVSSHPYAHRYNTACVTNRRLHVHACLFHRQNNPVLHACRASAPTLQHALVHVHVLVLVHVHAHVHAHVHVRVRVRVMATCQVPL